MKPLLLCAIALVACRPAWAGCCKHCGCDASCQKVCRVICEVKKVPKVTYDCECEDFCIPGKSCRTTVRDECGCKKHIYTPGCGHVRTRTKLVKHEEMEEKVVYKWVVEDLCCGCKERCAAADREAAEGNPELAARQQSTAGSAAEHAEVQVGYEQAALLEGEEEPATGKFDLKRIFRFGRKD